MSNEPSQLQQMKPYLLIAGVLVVILLAILLWPSSTEDESATNLLPTNVETAPAAGLSNGIDDTVTPDVFEAPPTPNEVEITGDMNVIEFESKEVVVNVPAGISDASVKTALMAVATSPTFAKLLVNDRLIDKFVINVNSLSNAQISTKDALVVPPEQPFKTYSQADRVWIDNSSFQRYNTYVDALESVDSKQLLKVFESYEKTIKDKFAEVSRPGQSFDSALIEAIDTLLNTPQVPVPIEVYTNSVMFKFKDERLEKLSSAQKQMLRTGPENMRRIKDVLRKMKQELEARNP